MSRRYQTMLNFAMGYVLKALGKSSFNTSERELKSGMVGVTAGHPLF